MKPPQDTVSPKQAAAEIGIHPVTLRKWILSGRLPVTREGRAVLIHMADLEPFRALSEPRRTCPECKATFAPSHKKAVFCSDHCRDAAKNRKVSLAKKEAKRQKAIDTANRFKKALEEVHAKIRPGVFRHLTISG